MRCGTGVPTRSTSWPHAGAGEVTIRILDDGCGIPQPLPETDGLGVRTMPYRAGIIGAAWRYQGRHGGDLHLELQQIGSGAGKPLTCPRRRWGCIPWHTRTRQPKITK